MKHFVQKQHTKNTNEYLNNECNFLMENGFGNSEGVKNDA